MPRFLTAANTGPKEHWFLSVNAPATDVSKFKFNSKTNRLEPEDSSFLHLGLDYMLGDLFLDNGGGVLKGLVTLSSDPLESAGIGTGYRFGSWSGPGGFELNQFFPYVALVRTREDEMLTDGQVGRGTGSAEKVVVGISFSFDKAGGFLKKKKANGGG